MGHESSTAPIYDIVGWVTENEASDIKTKIDPPRSGAKVQRSTITRWRYGGYIQAIHLAGKLVLVNLSQVVEFQGLPIGNPSTSNEEFPDRAPSLPDTITLTLKRRRRQ